MKRVFVGLSGGVDSAVSAYLLKQQGYAVTGVFIKGWEPDFLPCTGAADRLSAMQVAAHLGIPFKTYDLGEEYKARVVDYFVNEYRVGRTPNPDVMCNRMIKFGAMWDLSRADGADFIATGHYARITDTSQLAISKDSEKDQTYFLWTLTQDDLAHTLFPVGGLTKSEVRAIAKKIKLPNAERKDSQGLCFLGHVDMQSFLSRFLPEAHGDIVDQHGTKIGEHDGAWYYTLGQHVALATGERLYVIERDVVQQRIVVSPQPRGGTATHQLRDIQWARGSAPTKPILARYRYRQELLPVSVSGSSVTFKQKELIAEGQSIVFYSIHGAVEGGAIIG
ncbi:MAG: hypothetical protein RLZZ283_468 [Candidatus Parcubacteria bacterium]|jgi:tRNA-specific 2-thiouridylase